MLPFLTDPLRQPVAARTAWPATRAGPSTTPATRSPPRSAAGRARWCSPVAAPRATTPPSPARCAAAPGAPSARPPSTTPCCTSVERHGGHRRRCRRVRPRRRRPPCVTRSRGPHRPGRARRRRCRSWRSTTRSAPINDLAALAAARARQRAGRRAPHRRRPGGRLARPARDLAARRPAVAERPQVRRPQGRRRRSSCATGVGRRSAHRRRRPGARSAQRHPQRRRDRRHGRGDGGTDAEREVEIERIGALRDRLVAGCWTASVGVRRDRAARRPRCAGSAHLLVEGVESEALLYLLDQAGVCASAASACASGAMERVARARRDGHRSRMVARVRCG